VSLRAVRAQRSGFDARFFERDPRFEPIVPAARLVVREAWPTVAAIDAAFRERAGIRFVVAKPRPRRKRGPVSVGDLYDAHIARGEVPTREQNWHDLLNALVWATFPRAKAALHARQHRAIREWAGDSVVRRLPNARTRELDALALIDEGGIVVCGDGRAIFGHALYEGLVFETPAMIARAVVLGGSLADADGLLAARLTRALAPEDLPRIAC
jgi:hypothetical protein